MKYRIRQTNKNSFRAQVRVFGIWMTTERYTQFHFHLSDSSYPARFSDIKDAQQSIERLAKDLRIARTKTKTIATGKMEDEMFLDAV